MTPPRGRSWVDAVKNTIVSSSRSAGISCRASSVTPIGDVTTAKLAVSLGQPWPSLAFAPSEVRGHSRAEDGLSALESHKRHLDAILQTLGDAQLYVNLQKSVIGVPEIPVLGCIVGTHGVRADPEKVKAVNKNYAEQAKPLFNFLKEDAEWTWSKKKVDAFTSVKKSLVEAPVLALPEGENPFIVFCDASNFAIGSALMQKDDNGIDRVFSYQYQLLKAAELNGWCRMPCGKALEWVYSALM
ncbi:unnamed protein product, partial [Peronospora farinosa]